MVLNINVSHHWTIHKPDIKNAFLHGDLAEVVYMKQPPSYVHPDHPDHACLLRKALYGLKQALHAWNRRFAMYICYVGFTNSRSNSSLFTFHHELHTIYLLLYVDDIIIMASNPSFITRVITCLSTKFTMMD